MDTIPPADELEAEVERLRPAIQPGKSAVENPEESEIRRQRLAAINVVLQRDLQS